MFPRKLEGGIELQLCGVPHAPRLFALMERNRESLSQWLPWIHATHGVADVAAFLHRAQAQFDGGDGFHAGIFVEGEVAGFIGLHRIDWANQSVEIGYWLDAGYRGRGVMTAAVRGVVEICFEHYRLHRVEIRCGVENTESCAIPERLGFRLEGVLRQAQWVMGRALDLRVYSKLAWEWNSPP